MKKTLVPILLFLLLLLPLTAFSAPSISGVSGTIADGQTVTISGSGFGTKSPAKPLVYASFESSINPSSLGQITAWGQTTNVARGTAGARSGSYSAISSSGADSAMGIYLPDQPYGQKLYVFLWRKADQAVADYFGNWKFFRAWETPHVAPDFYLGLQDTWPLLYTEACGIDPARVTNSYVKPGTTWRSEEFQIQYSSGANVADATFKGWLNNIPFISTTSWTTSCTDTPGTQDYIYIQDDCSNGCPTSGSVYYDDIYIDNTWQRIILGNASTLANSTQREIQIPSAWSTVGENSTIDVTINQGAFSDGQSVYLYVVDSTGAVNSTGYPVVIGSIGADTIPPERSNGSPSGALPVGTTSTTMSLTTHEPATCKFSTTPGTSYAVMPGTFSTTGNLSHSVLVSSLTDGGNYSRYVRCSDAVGNANTTDYQISWSVLQDTEPPTLMNGYPEGALPPDTTQVSMSLTTSEPATCKYSTSPGTAYASMPSTFATTGGTSHSQLVTGLANGVTYNRYVRCADPSGNATVQDFPITWTVGIPDTTPPEISGGAPSGQLDPGTTQVTMSVATDENATCRYADASGTAYASMTNTFSSTGGMSHSTTITGLTDNSSHTKYVRCIDADSNANSTDYEVSWTIARTDMNTYPEIVAVVGTEVEATLLTHAISIPSGDNGDLLMIIVRTPDATHSMTGWTQLATRSSFGRSTVFIRTADGSEGATANLTTNVAVRSAALAYRIRNHNPLGVTAQFAATNVNDPPALTPSWSLTPVRWFAVMTNQRSDSTVTAAPAWFYGLQTKANLTSTNTNRQRVSAAWRTQRVGTIDPGAFPTSGTIGSPHSVTIGISVSTVGVKKARFIEKIGKKTFLNNPLKWLKFIR